MNGEIQHPSKRSTDNESLVIFLRDLDQQVTSIKTTQAAQEGITNRFIQDLGRLSDTVNTMILKYQETSPASMEDLRRLNDECKDDIKDIQMQILKLTGSNERFQEIIRKLDRDHDNFEGCNTLAREQAIKVDHVISNINKDLEGLRTRMEAVERALMDVLDRIRDTTATVRTLKHVFIIVSGFIGACMTAFGWWQQVSG